GIYCMRLSRKNPDSIYLIGYMLETPTWYDPNSRLGRKADELTGRYVEELEVKEEDLPPSYRYFYPK
ncbi:MAG: hypothetical protein J7K98_00360, partial [Candidatus Aenigmarchaeota archaeon]|nr:hypothetical protein [Candidatus Aenigmarchaeota archaeon]